jgi:hypothetical protein
MNLDLTLKTPRVFITKANFSMVFTAALAVLCDKQPFETQNYITLADFGDSSCKSSWYILISICTAVCTDITAHCSMYRYHCALQYVPIPLRTAVCTDTTAHCSMY